MESFLYNVAKQLSEKHRGHLEQVCVVFNNRRAGLFLQKQLQTLGDRPFFLPRVIGIDDLVNTLGKQQIAPHEFLLFELFDIHRNLEGVERRFETFEEFISFGEMMLNDFSEVDLYCVDARQLFENLNELKQLGEWDISGAPLTPFQEKYLNFYRSLYQYYTLFRQRLADQGRAYTGMAYRNVAENIDSLCNEIEYIHLYFVGFNALSTCEQRIIDCLVRQGRASVLFDGDAYYVDNPTQEAGHFLRKHAGRYPGVGPFDNHFALKPKTIHIVNCPENVLQAKQAGRIIGHIAEEQAETTGSKENIHLEETAVVLADESLLLPVLNSLPDSVRATNVTMGYPFTLTGTHNLVSKLFALYCGRHHRGFYHADVTALLSDALIERLVGIDKPHSIAVQEISDSKSIYLSPDEATALLRRCVGTTADSLAFLFADDAPTTSELLLMLRRTINLIVESNILDDNVKEQEAVACLIQMLNYFDELQRHYRFVEQIDTLQRIYQRLAQRRSVAFYGEPLQGLQLLGMLETRSLDFTRVVITSLNEGTLPTGRGDNTLIPLSLKRAFGIPTFEEKDAVYAYNLYRLLQRCDEAWLLYSSHAESLGKGEPSRFILQIRDELAERHPNITVVEEVVTATNTPPSERPVTTARKGEEVMRRLNELAAKGFSPSALNRFRNCPMQFYYEDVLGVHELEEVSEELESNELGSFIHAILCDIYRIDPSGDVQAATLRRALDEVDALVDRRLKDEVLRRRSDEGKNHLYAEVAKIQIANFLKKEIAFLQHDSIHIVMTEEEMLEPLPLPGGGPTVNIKGFADRVDVVGGQLRIADYKSGGVDPRELRVDDTEADPHDVPDKWFQVMAYAWLYCRKHGHRDTFTSGIFPLRALGADFMPASWAGNSRLGADDIDRFGQMLQSLVGEMLNPKVDFVAAPRKEGCKYCPFARSCTPLEK